MHRQANVHGLNRAGRPAEGRRKAQPARPDAAVRTAFRQVLGQLPQAALIVRARDQRITFLNDSARSLFGPQAEGAVFSQAGLNFTSMSGAALPPADQPLLKPLYKLAQVRDEEVCLARPGGGMATLLVNAGPIFGDKGKIDSAVALVQDITERKAAERAREDLVAVAGHELRSPLASLKGWAQLTERRIAHGTSVTAQQVLLDVTRQISSMEALVNQLFDTAQLERQRLQLDSVDFDLAAAVRRTVDGLPPEWSDRVIFRHRDAVLVRGDRERLQRMLLNLLSNALRYSAADKPVRVMLLHHAGDLLLRVCDRGVGIAPTELPHVFERFYRAASSSHRSGLGLGLYISKEIVEAHHGHLRVNSVQGKGSVFSVLLPQAALLPKSPTAQ